MLWLFNTEVSSYSARSVRASPAAVSLRLRVSGAPHSTASVRSASSDLGKCRPGSPDGEREGNIYLSETKPGTPSLVVRRYYYSECYTLPLLTVVCISCPADQSESRAEGVSPDSSCVLPAGQPRSAFWRPATRLANFLLIWPGVFTRYVIFCTVRPETGQDRQED